MALKKKFLGEMKMPPSRGPAPKRAPSEAEDEAAPDEEDLEADLFGADEDGSEGDANSPAAELSDDELLAEAKRRGLRVEAPAEPEEEIEDDAGEDDMEEDDLDLE